MHTHIYAIMGLVKTSKSIAGAVVIDLTNDPPKKKQRMVDGESSGRAGAASYSTCFDKAWLDDDDYKDIGED